MIPISLRYTTLYIRDRGANYIQVRIGEGNLTYAEKRNIIFAKARGALPGRTREGDDEGVDVQFQFIWDQITAHDGTIITVEDALKRLENASGWVSTSTDQDAPYCVDMQIQFNPQCANFQEGIYFSQFNYTNLDHSMKDATVSCSGTCNYKKGIPF